MTLRIAPALGALALCLPLAGALAADAGPGDDLRQALRCSAVFAIVAADQKDGANHADRFPPLALRGREYFVRSGAALMDALSLSREQVEAMMRAEVGQVQGEVAAEANPAAALDAIMKPCLVRLDAEVPPGA